MRMYKNPPSDLWLNRAGLVRERLMQYEGEYITANEHPLWLAVVDLEHISVETTGRQRYKLHYPAGPWFRTIWASRAGPVQDAVDWADIFLSILDLQMEIVKAGCLPVCLSKNSEYLEKVSVFWPRK